uniref:Uncharacterized protein n=1 Tax=Arundo donax TaxID=35708 RepID=A0A0A9C716_ARUDO
MKCQEYQTCWSFLLSCDGILN